MQFDELQRNFVAIASHELRTPAASVYGALATLRGRRDALPSDTIDQLNEIAWQESDRMRRLIEQLLDLSRVDAGRMKLSRQQVDARQFVARAVGPSSDVEIEIGEGIVADVDPVILERVVSNLVANARAYGRPPIHVTAAVDGATLTIVIEDEGVGVPMEIVPRLFDRFVRGREGHGSGLGLAIARAYTAAHGGDLRYRRATRGARFEIVLPDAL
jgi:two-component system sensor histidine kinase MtrB